MRCKRSLSVQPSEVSDSEDNSIQEAACKSRARKAPRKQPGCPVYRSKANKLRDFYRICCRVLGGEVAVNASSATECEVYSSFLMFLGVNLQQAECDAKDALSLYDENPLIIGCLGEELVVQKDILRELMQSDRPDRALPSCRYDIQLFKTWCANTVSAYEVVLQKFMDNETPELQRWLREHELQVSDAAKVAPILACWQWLSSCYDSTAEFFPLAGLKFLKPEVIRGKEKAGPVSANIKRIAWHRNHAHDRELCAWLFGTRVSLHSSCDVWPAQACISNKRSGKVVAKSSSKTGKVQVNSSDAASMPVDTPKPTAAAKRSCKRPKKTDAEVAKPTTMLDKQPVSEPNEPRDSMAPISVQTIKQQHMDAVAPSDFPPCHLMDSLLSPSHQQGFERGWSDILPVPGEHGDCDVQSSPTSPMVKCNSTPVPRAAVPLEASVPGPVAVSGVPCLSAGNFQQQPLPSHAAAARAVVKSVPPRQFVPPDDLTAPQSRTSTPRSQARTQSSAAGTAFASPANSHRMLHAHSMPMATGGSNGRLPPQSSPQGRVSSIGMARSHSGFKGAAVSSAMSPMWPGSSLGQSRGDDYSSSSNSTKFVHCHARFNPSGLSPTLRSPSGLGGQSPSTTDRYCTHVPTSGTLIEQRGGASHDVERAGSGALQWPALFASASGSLESMPSSIIDQFGPLLTLNDRQASMVRQGSVGVGGEFSSTPMSVNSERVRYDMPRAPVRQHSMDLQSSSRLVRQHSTDVHASNQHAGWRFASPFTARLNPVSNTNSFNNYGNESSRLVYNTGNSGYYQQDLLGANAMQMGRSFQRATGEQGSTLCPRSSKSAVSEAYVDHLQHARTASHTQRNQVATATYGMQRNRYTSNAMQLPVSMTNAASAERRHQFDQRVYRDAFDQQGDFYGGSRVAEGCMTSQIASMPGSFKAQMRNPDDLANEFDAMDTAWSVNGLPWVGSDAMDTFDIFTDNGDLDNQGIARGGDVFGQDTFGLPQPASGKQGASNSGGLSSSSAEASQIDAWDVSLECSLSDDEFEQCMDLVAPKQQHASSSAEDFRKPEWQTGALSKQQTQQVAASTPFSNPWPQAPKFGASAMQDENVLESLFDDSLLQSLHGPVVSTEELLMQSLADELLD